MSAAYLEKLNREQRLAVEHGVGTTEADDNRALLILAGAGTGKTNTLAYRVVHLVLNGADPRRILLMTFSRRAAAAIVTLERNCRINPAHLGRLERRNGARRRGVHQESMVRAGIERTSPSRHCF